MYATIKNGVLEYAGKVIRLDGRVIINPKSEHFVLVNAERAEKNLPPYLPNVIDEPPQTDSAHYAVPTGYEQDGDAWRRLYEVREVPPPPPRRWTRFSLKGALADARLLPAAKAFLGAYELKPDYTALEAFTDVDYIEEFYGGTKKWNALLDGAAQALGMTRAEIDAFLDAIPVEG